MFKKCLPWETECIAMLKEKIISTADNKRLGRMFGLFNVNKIIARTRPWAAPINKIISIVVKDDSTMAGYLFT